MVINSQIVNKGHSIYVAPSVEAVFLESGLPLMDLSGEGGFDPTNPVDD